MTSLFASIFPVQTVWLSKKCAASTLPVPPSGVTKVLAMLNLAVAKAIGEQLMHQARGVLDHLPSSRAIHPLTNAL